MRYAIITLVLLVSAFALMPSRAHAQNRDALINMAVQIAGPAIQGLISGDASRAGRALQRGLKRAGKQLAHLAWDEAQHVIETWVDGVPELAHLRKCKVCHKLARSVMRGTKWAGEVPKYRKRRYKRRPTWDEHADDPWGSQNDLRPPPPQVARWCVTQWGSCSMMMALPQGASCTCAMPQGMFPGVAR